VFFYIKTIKKAQILMFFKDTSLKKSPNMIFDENTDGNTKKD